MSVYRPAERFRLLYPEVLRRRNLVSKTYDLGSGQFRLMQSMGPIHYQEDDGSWQEIDLTPEDRGDHWRIERGLYRLTIWKDAPGIEYESRAGGAATVALDSIAGAKPRVVAPKMDGLCCRWANCAEDFDLELTFRPVGIQWVKALKSDRAPREWAFTVEERGKPVEQRLAGKDAAERALDLSDTLTEGGGRRLIVETFGGRASEVVDRKTRRRAWSDAVEYPVRVF